MPVPPSSFILATAATQTSYIDPKETEESSYPERYIFLVLALAIIVKIFRILQRHRLDHEFDGYMGRTDVASNDSSSFLPGYTAHPAADISSIEARPNDDPYIAAAFSLNIHGSEVQPPPEYGAVVAQCTSHNAAILPPPPYVQAKPSPPPAEPLNLPESGFD